MVRRSLQVPAELDARVLAYAKEHEVSAMEAYRFLVDQGERLARLTQVMRIAPLAVNLGGT